MIVYSNTTRPSGVLSCMPYVTGVSVYAPPDGPCPAAGALDNAAATPSASTSVTCVLIAFIEIG
jgi:hypothetical protein